MAQALRSSELGPCSALKSVTPLDRELFSVHENSFSEDLLFSESSPDFDVFLSENCYFSPPASPGSTESGVDALKPCMNSFIYVFHYEVLGTTPIPDPGQPVL